MIQTLVLCIFRRMQLACYYTKDVPMLDVVFEMMVSHKLYVWQLNFGFDKKTVRMSYSPNFFTNARKY